MKLIAEILASQSEQANRKREIIFRRTDSVKIASPEVRRFRANNSKNIKLVRVLNSNLRARVSRVLKREYRNARLKLKYSIECGIDGKTTR